MSRQAELEHEHLRRFCAQLEVPEGSLEKSENPDFVLTKPGGDRLGIELTRVYKAESARQAAAEADIIVDMAKGLQDPWVPENLNVKVDFAQGAAIKRKDRQDIAKLIRSLVSKHAGLVQPWQHVAINYSPPAWENLPNYLVQLQLSMVPAEIDPIGHWYANPSDWMGLAISATLDAIEQKNLNIARYRQNCDECWLVLVIEFASGPSLIANSEQSASQIEKRGKSSFDRTFLLHLGSNTVTEFNFCSRGASAD